MKKKSEHPFFNYSFLFLLLANSMLGSPLIEGGKVYEQDKDPQFISSVIQIITESSLIKNRRDAGSGVFISPNWVLTAAHLFVVQDTYKNSFRVLDKKAIEDHFARSFGRLVKKVHFHPSYLRKQKKLFEHKVKLIPYERQLIPLAERLDSGELSEKEHARLDRQFNQILAEIELRFPDERIKPMTMRADESDLVLIELYDDHKNVKSNPSKKISFPKLPNNQYEIQENESLYVAGWGLTMRVWRNGDWQGVANHQLNWGVTAYQMFKPGQGRDELDSSLNQQFMQEKKYLISHIESSHFIQQDINGKLGETSDLKGKSMSHHGDSGGAAFHVNAAGEPYLIGIHSSNTKPFDFSAEVAFRENHQSIPNYVLLDEFPEDWGDQTKSILNFSHIMDISADSELFKQLSPKTLKLNRKGSYQAKYPDLVIRKYNFKQNIYMIDLRSEEKQKFLRKYLK